MIISCDFQVHCISLLPPAVVNRILLLKMVAFPFKNTTYTFWKLQEVACARQSAALELGSSSLETAFMYSKTLLILPIFNENHNQYMAASCKYAWNQTGEIWITAPSEILLKKWLSKRGEMGGERWRNGRVGVRGPQWPNEISKIVPKWQKLKILHYWSQFSWVFWCRFIFGWETDFQS